MDKQEYFENEYTKMWVQDGILFTTYPDNLIITLEIAKECIGQRLEFQRGEIYPMFCDIRPLKDTLPEARAYMSKGDGIKGLSAGAFIIKSQIEKFLFNALFRINKPPIPGKMFTDPEVALKWLQQFKHFQ
jgi:hypothetical protein